MMDTLDLDRISFRVSDNGDLWIEMGPDWDSSGGVVWIKAAEGEQLLSYLQKWLDQTAKQVKP